MKIIFFGVGEVSGIWIYKQASLKLVSASLFPAAYSEHFAHGQHPVAKVHLLGFLRFIVDCPLPSNTEYCVVSQRTCQ